jgi:hypothetical protein
MTDIHAGPLPRYEVNGVTHFYSTPRSAGSVSEAADFNCQLGKDGTLNIAGAYATAQSYARQSAINAAYPLRTVAAKNNRPIAVASAFTQIPYFIGQSHPQLPWVLQVLRLSTGCLSLHTNPVFHRSVPPPASVGTSSTALKYWLPQPSHKSRISSVSPTPSFRGYFKYCA